MPVGAEGYSAGASVRGHLQRIINAFSTAFYTCFRVYDFGVAMEVNSGLRRLADEVRPALPVALVAGALRTNEKAPRRIVKWRACQQVFYLAIAKQAFGIAVHVLERRHANRP